MKSKQEARSQVVMFAGGSGGGRRFQTANQQRQKREFSALTWDPEPTSQRARAASLTPRPALRPRKALTHIDRCPPSRNV